MSKIIKNLNPQVQVIGNESPPRSGAFEVSKNGELIFSKFDKGSFPDESTIKNWIK